MAGIGFTLRKLALQDNLLGLVQGYALSGVVSMGPWLLTILALSAINVLGGRLGGLNAVADFRTVVIYNFALSLVLSGPMLVVLTRYLADRIFERRVDHAQDVFLAALALTLVLQAPPVALFYGLGVDLDPLVRLLAVVDFLLISGIWLGMVFLSAVKHYAAIGVAFLAGLSAGVVLALVLLPGMGMAGILLGFNVGLAIVLFSMVGAIMATFPFPGGRPFAFLGYFRRYWDLALIGLVYNLAIWVDKFVMWTAPEALVMDSGLVTNPLYDSATFLAYLTVVPAMSTFVIDIETAFFERYRRFYRDIQDHVSFAAIERNLKDLGALLLDKLRTLTVLQGSVAVAAILVAPRLFDALQINFTQMGVFRLAVLGSLFHMLFLFPCIILAYFDLRRLVLGISLTFLILNAGLTALSIELGFRFYGYGYFLACLLSAALALVLGARAVSRLPYLAFVKVNSSIS